MRFSPGAVAATLVIAAVVTGIQAPRAVHFLGRSTASSSNAAPAASSNGNGGNSPSTSGDCGSSGPFVSYTAAYSSASPRGYRVTKATVSNLVEKNCNTRSVVVTLSSATSALASASAAIGSGNFAVVSFATPPPARDVTQVSVQLCSQPNGNGNGNCQQVAP